MTPVDSAARETALDPLESFCISAPAGSGKTGLLVQRFLVLLGRVRAPESVIAITFTRKAAAEMRARVLTALRDAAENTPLSSEHERRTREAALAVLQHDAAQQWGLLRYPARLAIQTIDSFCGELTRQMPVLSGCGGPVRVGDDAAPLYREAIERFLQDLLVDGDEARRSDLRDLLLHLDNRWESLIALLSRLLARREQWRTVFGARGLCEEQRAVLEETAEALVLHRLAQLRRRLGARCAQLESLSAYRAENLESATIFDASSDDLGAWQTLATLLLTGQDTWRKQVTKREGFPRGRGAPAERKAQMLELIGELAEEDDGGLRDMIAELRLLPDPSARGEHWEVLAALTRLLPRLLAELLLVFRQRGEVDHAQVAMAALEALGEDDMPTDLALRLDYRIEHLLVDEFQDTSSLQFELLRRLTRGWAEHNAQDREAPRTLLLVGDPMQSIYGFREANVGLFIRARDRGIGDLGLRSLELRVNFRSAASLVRWSNDCFSRAFPREDDTAVGAVAFRPADAARPASAAARLSVFGGPGAAAAEIEALCDAVAEGLADPSTRTLAILGRSRNQLRPCLHALRERGIEFAARDFDPLDTSPVVRDLVSLATVLSDDHDRFAFLSLLRTPPIALDHGDLLCMARHVPTAGALRSPDAEAGLVLLSDPGRERVEHLRAVLAWAEHYRDRLAARIWIEETWLLLGGPGSLASAADADDASQFLRLVENFELAQTPVNHGTLTEALSSLYASPGSDDCRLQVMTLHKAKGLEFDRVFIPALGADTRGSDTELLLWDEVTLPDEAPAILLDIRAEVGGESQGRLFDFLQAQRRRKTQLEATRLLYVGCTRAADHLWLSGCLRWNEEDESPRPPRSGSLLATLWDSLPAAPAVQYAESTEDGELPELSYRRLRTLPAVPVTTVPASARQDDLVDARLARSLGTALHRCLEAIVYRAELPRRCDDALDALLRATLVDTGTDREELDAQCEAGRAAIDRTLGDDWLRWALDARREARRPEWPLTLVTDDGPQSLVLDYAFTDEATGERWIVDYKTAAPRHDESIDAFTAAQLEAYRPQLEAYRAALRTAAEGPVRCALYFTALALHAELPDG